MRELVKLVLAGLRGLAMNETKKKTPTTDQLRRRWIRACRVIRSWAPILPPPLGNRRRGRWISADGGGACARSREARRQAAGAVQEVAAAYSARWTLNSPQTPKDLSHRVSIRPVGAVHTSRRARSDDTDVVSNDDLKS